MLKTPFGWLWAWTFNEGNFWKTLEIKTERCEWGEIITDFF